MSRFIITIIKKFKYESLVCIYACVPNTCLVSLVARRRSLELATDSCELPHRYWKSNLGHQEK